LPRAVCTRTAKGLRVYATRSCSPKTNRTPTCGAWSAVTKPTPTEDAGTSAEGGGPGWKVVPVDNPEHLRIAGPGSDRRLYFTVLKGATTEVLSCNTGDCSAAALRCEGKFPGRIGAMTVQQRSPTEAPSAIYATTGPNTVEVVTSLGACNASTPVSLPQAPAAIFDIGATPTELLVLEDTRLASCGTSDPTRCQLQQVIPLSAPTPPFIGGKLDVRASVAYIHGTKVGGCKSSACLPAESNDRDVATDGAGPPGDIVALPGNYFWLDQRGPNVTVRDCPNSGPCGGLDLTRPGAFLSLAATDRFLYLGVRDGLYRAARPSVPPGPAPDANRVEEADEVFDVEAEGNNVYYLTPKGLFRFIDSGN
jgi:hypothetical protein